MSIQDQIVINQLNRICDELGLKIKLKQFQLDFFLKAITGVNGFLKVSFLFASLSIAIIAQQ